MHVSDISGIVVKIGPANSSMDTMINYLSTMISKHTIKKGINWMRV